MPSHKYFMIRLANGKEQSFESAAAMVEWMERQRGLESPRRRMSQRNSRPHNQPKTRHSPNEPPLARFARRRGC